MVRKSERVVKSSPTKKTEPASRRTTRRGRKSPEKSVEEESENASDQASSSDNEPEEVIAPKRTRRTSRTIEKSSSAEEVKATTTTRPRRRGAKKDQEIQEEEEGEADAEAAADQTTVNEAKEKEKETDKDKDKDIEIVEEPAHTIETASVDSSTEPAPSQIQAESSNSVQNAIEEHTASIETEIEKKTIEKTEKPTPIEPPKPDVVEKVESSKTRRRTLKRVERVISKEEVAIAPETTEKSLKEKETEIENKNEQTLDDEVKSSDDAKVTDTETPARASQLQNGNNISDAADTTAKDTTASETDACAKLNKKKPIVRKRKWLSNKSATPKVQEITISTDSLKGLISDVKPVPLSDVKLDSSPELDHESDDVKVVSSTSIDYNRRSEEHLVESTDDANVASISTSRKISVITESEGEQPLSPAKHNPCNILYITNLVRPFTVLQLKSLLQRTGKIAEDGFWIDKIKSKCFVKYETEE